MYFKIFVFICFISFRLSLVNCVDLTQIENNLSTQEESHSLSVAFNEIEKSSRASFIAEEIEFARIKTRYKFITNVEKTAFKVSEAVFKVRHNFFLFKIKAFIQSLVNSNLRNHNHIHHYKNLMQNYYLNIVYKNLYFQVLHILIEIIHHLFFSH